MSTNSQWQIVKIVLLALDMLCWFVIFGGTDIFKSSEATLIFSLGIPSVSLLALHLVDNLRHRVAFSGETPKQFTNRVLAVYASSFRNLLQR